MYVEYYLDSFAKLRVHNLDHLFSNLRYVSNKQAKEERKKMEYSFIQTEINHVFPDLTDERNQGSWNQN